jgi:hypothetical protein
MSRFNLGAPSFSSYGRQPVRPFVRLPFERTGFTLFAMPIFRCAKGEGMADTAMTPQMREWAEQAIRRMRRKSSPVETRRKRRLLVVHLDGVPRAVLEDAVTNARMPFFASLVRSGQYRLDGAFWGSPASTPCFQAGLLYGIRHPNLPAYHWYDRDFGRIIRMNVPRDAYSVEQRLGTFGRGSLLEDGGTAYLSLFRAQATNRLSMTSLADLKSMSASLVQDLKGIRGPKRRGVLAYLRHLFHDTWHAGRDALRWSRRLGDARHEREYVLNRFFMIQLGWELSHSRALIDMVRGVPAIYLVFGSFDEIAHRRGPLSEQAVSELYRVDGALRELYAVARSLPEPYDLYFVTDHGHVDSAPFEKRTGTTLKDHLLNGPPAPLLEGLERALLDGRDPPHAVPPTVARDEPIVIDAGNFAHVYLSPRDGTPLEAADLLARHREVLARAAMQRDIGIVALRRGQGAVALVQGQVYGPEDLARAPLSSEFSKRAVRDLLHELPHMPTAGDLVLYGEATHPGGTVGFAWEFGSHGGLTETETRSVVCWPTRAPVDLSSLGHVTELHERLSELYRC